MCHQACAPVNWLIDFEAKNIPGYFLFVWVQHPSSLNVENWQLMYVADQVYYHCVMIYCCLWGPLPKLDTADLFFVELLTKIEDYQFEFLVFFKCAMNTCLVLPHWRLILSANSTPYCQHDSQGLHCSRWCNWGRHHLNCSAYWWDAKTGWDPDSRRAAPQAYCWRIWLG